MAGNVPTTRATCKVSLKYKTYAQNHKHSIWVRDSLTSLGPALDAATELASIVQPLLTSSCAIIGWQVHSYAGVRLFDAAFSSPLAGTRSVSGSYTASNSATYTLSTYGEIITAGDIGMKVDYKLFSGFYLPTLGSRAFVTTGYDTYIGNLETAGSFTVVNKYAQTPLNQTETTQKLDDRMYKKWGF